MSDFPNQVGGRRQDADDHKSVCRGCGKDYVPRSGILPPMYCNECLAGTTTLE